MDSLSKVLKEIDALVAELKSLLPMKKEDEERLWRKFRLEWNYNSNHIEGNTLTYGQTELLLIFDKTTGDHDMREYEEMKAHDVAVQLVRDYAADPDRELTEADIREFNKIILVRPFWGNAQTPDGQPTRKQIVPGEYKREPNSVLLQNGEMFHYATPEETPAKMQALVEWYRKASAEKKEHAVVIAAKLHYEFVRIHPFDDCNGRTSRLLMNYVLLRNGLPPVIIKTADKKGYLNALNKADVGDLNAFVEYVAKELKWSLEKTRAAAKGEEVEEVEDVFKEIEIFKKGNKVSDIVLKSKEVIAQLIEGSFDKLYKGLRNGHNTLRDLFIRDSASVYVGPSGIQIANDDQFIAYLKIRLIDQDSSRIDFTDEIAIQFIYTGLKSKRDSDDHLSSRVVIKLKPMVYEVSCANDLLTKRYDEAISNEEVKKITAISVKEVFAHVAK